MHRAGRSQISRLDSAVDDGDHGTTLLRVMEAMEKTLGVRTALRQAATAAAQGAEATRSMRAKFGRARNLGDRSLGAVDPGATSVALIFDGFHAALTETV